MKTKLNEFSVALGLFDYINPICYSVTTLTIIFNMFNTMTKPLLISFIIGAVISLIFGFTIPTVKLLVGLGKFEFKMPVNLVFYVNSGILISGLSILSYLYSLNIIQILCVLIPIILILIFIYSKSKKFNTIAVLTGAFGYILIYVTLLSFAIRNSVLVSIILYSLAILFFVFLCLLGIKSDLKKAKVHWVIETCNVSCQLFVAIATVLLFI